MIFQDYFQFFDIWDAVESGLYYTIVGFYFLILAYFLLMRFRTSKKLYWFYFSLLFLFLAAGRVFFIVYYFYAPELVITMSNLELVSFMMILYRFATFFTWLGISCLMGVFGTLILSPIADNDNSETGLKKFLRQKKVKLTLKICLIVIPIIVGILALTLSDALFMDPDLRDQYIPSFQLITIFNYPAGRFVLNIIFSISLCLLSIKNIRCFKAILCIKCNRIFHIFFGSSCSRITRCISSR